MTVPGTRCLNAFSSLKGHPCLRWSIQNDLRCAPRSHGIWCHLNRPDHDAHGPLAAEKREIHRAKQTGFVATFA